MSVARMANLAVRFLLELCAFAALAYWGARTGSTTLVATGLAISAPLLAATMWGLFVSPKAPVDIPAVRWVVELAVFGSAAAGLLAVGLGWLGLALLVLYAVNRTLISVWGQEGAAPTRPSPAS